MSITGKGALIPNSTLGRGRYIIQRLAKGCIDIVANGDLNTGK
ncbi:hypothetical protein [Desulfovibrio inopinatus]|nr:hypothetical protein [Desulfovibrio inopinatus]